VISKGIDSPWKERMSMFVTWWLNTKGDLSNLLEVIMEATDICARFECINGVMIDMSAFFVNPRMARAKWVLGLLQCWRNSYHPNIGKTPDH
jgi:hypothetical protein